MSEKRIALVTGANKGIGFEVARGLGRAGMTVLLGARDAGRGAGAATRLRNEGLDVRETLLDLGDEDTIRAAAESIEKEHGKLDVLVNNAGVNDPGDAAPSRADLAAVRRVFETNFFATLALTQAMLPLVRKGRSGRIVNVSSSLGSLADTAGPAYEYAFVDHVGYKSSKAALDMMTLLLAKELADAGIKVNAVDPGWTATDLTNNRGVQTVAEGAEAAIRMALLPDDGPTGGFFDRHGPRRW